MLKLVKKIFFYGLVCVFSLSAVATGATDTELKNPLTKNAGTLMGVAPLVGNAVKVLLGTAGVVSLIMFIVGGANFILSGGSSEKAKKGLDTLKWAVLGMVVVFGSYLFLSALTSLV